MTATESHLPAPGDATARSDATSGGTASGAGASGAPSAPGGLAGLLSSGEHRTVGRMWIVASLALGIFTLVCGLLLQFERAASPRIQVFAGMESFWQFFTLYRVGLIFLFAVPLWIGLATCVVPLQIGARAVAFPRAAASAFWVWLVGAGILIASWAIDGGLAPGGRQRAMELSLLALAVVVAALLMATGGLLTTILTQRPAGMRLDRVPLFTWSMLVAGGVWLLSLPVLLANLMIMWVDMRGPQAVRYGTAQSTYEQVSWVFEQPQVFAFAVPAIGVIGEILPVALGRPQRRWGTMLVLVGAVGVFSFGAHLQRFFAPAATTTPLYVVAGVVIAVLIVALLGGWADLARSSGRLPRPSGHLALGLATLGLLVVAAVVGFIRVIGGAVGFLRSFSRHNEAWQQDLNSALAPLDELRGSMAGAGLLDVVALVAVTGAVAGLFYWSPKLFGRHSSHAAGFGIAALTVAGGLVLGVMGLVAGFAGQPEQPSGSFTSTAAEVAAVLGAIALIAVLVGILGAVLVALRGAVALSGGVSSVPDPWGGHTLEWATASPPGAGAGAAVELAGGAVRSPHPLWDDPPAAASDAGGAGP